VRKKYFTALFAAALVLSAAPAAHASSALPATALVGLHYGSGAMDGANLLNKTGTGYRFGYLDADRTFHQVGSTDVKNISVVKTQNVYYGYKYGDGLVSYSDSIVSDILVGCWHVEPALTFATFEEAKAYADEVGGFPVWTGGTGEGGPYLVHIGAYGNKEDAQTALDAFLAAQTPPAEGTPEGSEAQAPTTGAKLAGTSAYGVSVVKTGTSQVLFQFDGGAEQSLAVLPGLDDSVKTVTHFYNEQFYGGFQYQRIKGGDLTISNFLPMDDYVSCVVSREMSASWPLEALKAQAVCARSYYQVNLGRHSGFDICSTTHCQAYHGMSRTTARTDQAAAETAGLGAWYQGKPAQTYYYSSNGGASENVKNVWGSSIPYLCGVVDPYEAYAADKNPYSSWSYTFTSAELTKKLQAKGYNAAAVVDVKVELSPTGNVKTLTLIDANGKSFPFVRTNVSSFLGVRSIHYTVTKTESGGVTVYYTDGGGTLSTMQGVSVIGGDGTITQLSGNPYVITGSGVEFLPAPEASGGGETTFRVDGGGWGHSVGMSQWGAYAMAQQGKTFEEILKFYYPGIEIY